MKRFISSILIICMIISVFSVKIYAEDNTAKYSNVHPRLLFSAEEFSAIKTKAEGELNGIYKSFIAECDEVAAAAPAEYYEDTNNEELWMRDVGDEIMKLSFAYVLTKNETYKEAAAARVETAAGYPTWGRGNSFENKDLAAAHLLVGISCYYDWLYHDLSDELKKIALDTLYYHGNIMKDCKAWWNRSYLQNHMWICLASVMATATAIYDEYPEAISWMEEPNYRYTQIFKYLSADGASQEGHLYWNYGMQFLIYYVKIANKMCNIDYSQNDFVKNTAKYGIYMTTPRNKVNGAVMDVFNFADSSANNGGSYLSTMSFLANLNRDKQTQWFINYLWNNYGDKAELWKMLMYYDTELEAEAPTEANFPKDKLFTELGYGFFRNDWTNNEDVVAFKCGKCLGTATPDNYTHSNFGTGHVHPDVNHFVIFSNGQRLLTDDGYVLARTKDHNTLNIDGAGQYGELNDWVLPEGTDATPVIEHFYGNDTYAFAVCNGTEAYTGEAGVEKFIRRFLYIKESKSLIVMDDVKLKDAETYPKAEIRFFPNITFKKVLDNNTFLFNNNIVNLKITPFENGNTVSYENVLRNTNKAQNTVSTPALIVSSDSGILNQITALTWSNQNDKTAEVTLISQDDEKAVFSVKNSVDSDMEVKYTVDFTANTVTREDVYPFSFKVDFENNMLTASGDVPFENAVKLSCKLVNPNGKLAYIGQASSTGGKLDVNIGLSGLVEGNYSFSLFAENYNAPVERTFSVSPDLVNLTLKSASIETGNPAAATAVLDNTTYSDKKFRLIIAVYDGQGRLTSVNTRDEVLTARTEKEYQISGENSSSDGYVKFMIWDEKLSPIISVQRKDK